MNSVIKDFKKMVEQAAIESSAKSKFYETIYRDINPIIEAINTGIETSTFDPDKHGLNLDYCQNSMFLITFGNDEIYRDHICELGYRATLMEDDYRDFKEIIAEAQTDLNNYTNPTTVATILAKALFKETEHLFNDEGYQACINYFNRPRERQPVPPTKK